MNNRGIILLILGAVDTDESSSQTNNDDKGPDTKPETEEPEKQDSESGQDATSKSKLGIKRPRSVSKPEVIFEDLVTPGHSIVAMSLAEFRALNTRKQEAPVDS